MITTLAAAIFLSAAPRGDLDAKADFKYPVMALSVLAQDLSARVKVPIRVTPDVGEFGVYVNVRDRSVREVLDLVAKATTSEWVEANGVITIRRTPVQVNAEAKRFFDRKLAEAKRNMATRRATEVSEEAMVKAIQEAKEIQQKLNQGYTEAFRNQLALLDAYTPAQLVGQELVDTLGLEALLRMAPGDRVVYSSHPTRLQRAMPSSMRNVIARFAELQEMLNRASDVAQIASEPRGSGSFSGLLNRGRLPGISRGEPAPVARVLIIINQSVHSQRMDVRAFDETGNQVIFANFESPIQALMTEEPPASGADKWGGTVKLTGEVAEINQLLHKLNQHALTDAERRRILTMRAEKRLIRNRETPLSASLDFWAERNGDLVMECQSVMYPVQTLEFSPGEFLNFVLAPRSVELIKDGNVTIGRAVSARYRGPGWNAEVPDSVMAKAILEKGTLDLDDLADLAAITPDDETYAGLMMQVPTLTGTTSPAPYLYDGVFPLRAYGLLSKADRKKAREQGMEWEISALPPRLRALVETELSRGKIVPGALGYSGDVDRSVRRVADPDEPQLSQYEREPTVLLTLDEARPIIFHLSFGTTPRILSQMITDGYSNYHFQLPKHVGEQLAITELAARQGVKYGGNIEYRYAEVTKGELTASFRLGKLPETKIIFPMIQEKSYSFGPLTSLSKEMQAAIDVAFKQTLEERKNTRFGGGGSGGPPPPPQSSR